MHGFTVVFRSTRWAIEVADRCRYTLAPNRIRELRAAGPGLVQADLARLLGASGYTVGHWEAGRMAPVLETPAGWLGASGWPSRSFSLDDRT